MNESRPSREIVVGIVILNYNGAGVLPELLRSLDNLDYPNFKVILVDNNSTDDSLEFARNYSAKFEMEIIANEANLLFSGGNNVGIKRALEWGAEYILLLNNDTIVPPTMLSSLVYFMAGTPNRGGAAIAGPLIHFAEPKGVIWFAGGFVNKWFGLVRHRGIREKDTNQYDNLAMVDYVSGCAMCVKRKVFEKIGFLDESFPMYFEDTDFCARAYKAGFEAYYVPTEPLIHKVSSSIGGQMSGVKIRRRFLSGLKFFARHSKWYQWPTIIIGQIYEAIRIGLMSASGRMK